MITHYYLRVFINGERDLRTKSFTSPIICSLINDCVITLTNVLADFSFTLVVLADKCRLFKVRLAFNLLSFNCCCCTFTACFALSTRDLCSATCLINLFIEALICWVDLFSDIISVRAFSIFSMLILAWLSYDAFEFLSSSVSLQYSWA